MLGFSSILAKRSIVKFIALFVLAYLALLIIFGCGDLLARLSSLPSLKLVPLIVVLLIPLISVMVMPLALSWASSWMIAQLFARHEIIFLSYLSFARRVIVLSLLCVVLVSAIVYIPLVNDWAPKKYWKAKQVIVSFAQEKLLQLAPGVIHYPTNQSMIYFENSHVVAMPEGGKETMFKHVFFSYYQEHGALCAGHAQVALLNERSLQLRNGTILVMRKDKPYHIEFDHFLLDLHALFVGSSVEDSETRLHQDQTKYLTLCELYQEMSVSKKAFVAFHERIVKIIWFLVLPFLSFYAMLWLSVIGASNLVGTILTAGTLFLISYVSESLALALWNSPFLALLILYGPLIFCVLFIFVRYRRHAII